MDKDRCQTKVAEEYYAACGVYLQLGDWREVWLTTFQIQL